MDQPGSPHRRMLVAAISSTLLERGFDSAESDVLETFAEMMQSFICEIGQTSRNYSELSGRTEPIIADVILAFVELGINFTKLSEYTKSTKHVVLPTLQMQSQSKQLSMLQAGVRQSLPNHIPVHFPQFPDPHSYIRTPTHKQPVIDYEAIREKFAIQKRDVEKALTKFLAKTSETHNLFENDELIFPLIACKPNFTSYLTALLPQDQVFDLEDLEYKMEEINAPPKKRAKTENEAKKVSKTTDAVDDNHDGDDENNNIDDDDDEVDLEKTSSASPLQSALDIDNPYLAATKLPNQTTAPSVPTHAHEVH